MTVTTGTRVTPFLRGVCWLILVLTAYALFKAFQLDPPLSVAWKISIVLGTVFFLYLFGYPALLGRGPPWLVLTQRNDSR
jgi:hypothetical protein